MSATAWRVRSALSRECWRTFHHCYMRADACLPLRSLTLMVSIHRARFTASMALFEQCKNCSSRFVRLLIGGVDQLRRESRVFEINPIRQLIG